jgi:hypothetical protein
MLMRVDDRQLGHAVLGAGLGARHVLHWVANVVQEVAMRYTIGPREANHHLAKHIKAVEEGTR